MDRRARQAGPARKLHEQQQSWGLCELGDECVDDECTRRMWGDATSPPRRGKSTETVRDKTKFLKSNFKNLENFAEECRAVHLHSKRLKLRGRDLGKHHPPN